VPGPRLRRTHSPLKQLERLCVIATCAVLWLPAGSRAAIAQAISRVPVINTIAGNGTAGYSGDGGPANSAELNSPSGIATDGSGNLYIADPANNRIREVAMGTGVISTFAGNGTAGYSGDGGPATNAELQLPVEVAVDSAGNLYIADQGNNVIRKVATNGTITTVAGNNAEGYSGDNGQATNATLYAPAGVALDSVGNLYIADAGNNRIRLVNTAGTITTYAGNGTAGYSGDNGAATSATLN
jgi:sugar lactone lactonase YvrE